MALGRGHKRARLAVLTAGLGAGRLGRAVTALLVFVLVFVSISISISLTVGLSLGLGASLLLAGTVVVSRGVDVTLLSWHGQASGAGWPRQSQEFEGGPWGSSDVVGCKIYSLR